ncbi:MAG: S1C family serine protease [Defluviitaleaceae bacterium]|nr:S1C family serine protease [Defluviitaleaceae bacterium]
MDDRKVHDLFGLTDIDKIQEEIEKDLSGNGRTGANEPQPNADFASFFIVPQEQEDKAFDNFSLEPTGFYRETIKATPRKSWVKTAVILFFVCTIGTGMLGFGIGSGWAFFTGRSGEGINLDMQGNNPESASLTGTLHVFEDVSEPAVSTISDMVELLAPSVVGITTYRDGSRFPFPETSFGSGIIFADTADRIFIATNLYVVRGGYRWDVSIAGGTPIPAFPVDFNRYYDLAVAYVYKEHLFAAGVTSVAFATFGDSDAMRIGDVVLAIGNAMGEGTSVTRGIISATERPVYLPARQFRELYPLMVMQTDAAINYGNSGGPLINTLGQIVGININQATGLIIGSAPVEGMGYSISSNIAAPILESMIANYRTPAIGIGGDDLANDDGNLAERWGIPDMGVLVQHVQPGRPADLAGIRQYDVITGFEGQPIFNMAQLQQAIRSREIGDVVEIRILRGGSFALTLHVELAIMVRENFGN